MYGHLIPCRGGKAIPLSKTSLSLGKRTGSQADGSKSYFCELELQKNNWTIKALRDEIEVRVNGHPVESQTIKSGDLIAIGKLRYRLELIEEEKTSRPPSRKRSSMFSMFGFGKQSARKDSEQPTGPPVLGVLIPSRGGKAIPLRKHRNTLGREQTCDVVINDKTVSSLHCGLEFLEGHWRIVDLGSTNGIMVDGIAYQKKWLLPGEEVMISLNRYRMEYQPDGSLPDDDDIPYTARSLTDIAGIGEEESERIASRHESLEERLFGSSTRDDPEETFENNDYEHSKLDHSE
ncbi:MAG: FHA domain-containing protein [Planctomycetaceae bacterium]|nr:FHA domain-containing protein [Planctomycetaceae bacterium]